ncbi:MAG TPA: hypothetical protein DDX71_05195 [Ruminococcus sp.]|nr:hypothetical protein [Ruminococcus sp.]
MNMQQMTSEQLTKRMQIIGKAALVMAALGIIITGRKLLPLLQALAGSFTVDISLTAVMLITSVISLVICVQLLPMLWRLCRNGLPYTVQNVRSLKVTAILMGVLSVLPALTEALLYIFTVTDESLLIRMRNGLLILIVGCNGFFIGICLLLLFIREIVYYGTMLQQESDETL